MNKQVNRYSAVLADNDRKYLRKLTGLLADTQMFYVKNFAFDGKQAYELTMKDKPDLLVLDLIMPIYDGFAVLEELQRNGYQYATKIVMISAVGIDYVFKKAETYGVNYLFIKPFNGEVFKRRLIDLMAQNNVSTLVFNHSNDPKDIITKHIKAVGITANVKGYYYLRDAILMVHEDFQLIGQLTTGLYMRVAEKYNTTPQRVERAMRHAIESAWNRGNINVREDFFGYTICDKKGKPTNGEFIAMLADRLQTELGCVD